MQRSASRESPIFAASARGKRSHGRFRVKALASISVGRFLRAHALLSPLSGGTARAQSPSIQMKPLETAAGTGDD
jgi:hypothetical protein